MKEGDTRNQATPAPLPRRFGRYVLLKSLARGSTGELFLAANQPAAPALVVKRLIQTELSLAPVAAETGAVVEGLRAVAGRPHPNLVAIREVGRAGTDPFAVLDLVQGKDLRRLLDRSVERRVRVSVEVALYIASELLKGLAHLHGSSPGRHHGQVNPGSVLVGYDGRVQLGGLAPARPRCDPAKLTGQTEILQRLEELAPEQLVTPETASRPAGEPAQVDSRTDVYGVGLVLDLLICGRRTPTPGEGPAEIASAVLERGHLPPSIRRPGVPLGVDALVMRALAPRPADRFAGAAAMQVEVEALVASLPKPTGPEQLADMLRFLFDKELAEEATERDALTRVLISSWSTWTGAYPAAIAAGSVAGPGPAQIPQAAPAESGAPRAPLIGTALRDVTPPPVGPMAGAPRPAPAAAPAPAAPAAAAARPKDATPPPERFAPRAFAPTAVGSRAPAAAAAAPGPAPAAPPAAAPAPAAPAAAPPMTNGPTASAPAPAASMDLDAEPDEGEAAAEDDPLVGQLIADRYRVLRLLGEGGMGRVYEAEHVAIGKQVAIKVLHPQYSRHPDVVTRFRREAQAASKIGHPNIVDVTDFGETVDGSVFFVMEHLAGLDLGQLLAAERCLEPERAIAIAVQICRALAAAHAAGIIHRDLKPENVFLIARDSTPDFVKVVDFGIAKSAEDTKVRQHRLTQPGLAMGTPEYMAPEQAAGKPIDHRVDIYALGTILYETITGRHPYTGLNVMEILTKKATEKPPSPSSLRPDLKLSPELEDVILRAMEKDPARRPATMGQLEYELNKCIKGRGMAVASLLGIDTLAAAAISHGAGSSLTPVSGVHTINHDLLRSGQSGSYPPAAQAIAMAAAAAGVLQPPDDLSQSGQRRIEEVLFELAVEQGQRSPTLPPAPAGQGGTPAPLSGAALAQAVPPPTEGFNAAGSTLLPPIQPAGSRPGPGATAASLIPPEPADRDSSVGQGPRTSKGGALRWVALVLVVALGGGGAWLWQSGRLAPLLAGMTGGPTARDGGRKLGTAPGSADGGATAADASVAASADAAGSADAAVAAAADAGEAAGDGGSASADAASAAADAGPALSPAETKAEIARLLGQARKALKARRFVEPKDNSVATHVARISALDPANLEAAQLRGQVAKELHQKAEKAWKAKSWGKAQDAYRNVLSLAPDDKLGKERLAAANVKLGEKALDRRKSDEAIEMARLALVQMPDDVDALWLIARAELKRKNYPEAATAYGRILALQPSHADAQKALKAVQKRLKPQK